MKCLIVVDMQNDFISGVLGTTEAVKIVPAVVSEIKKRRAEGYKIIYTRDTHYEIADGVHIPYMNSLEGQNLPIPHCIKNTNGWQLAPEIQEAVQPEDTLIDKLTFGSLELLHYLKDEDLECIELVGLCTDICVVSNAIIMRTSHKDTPIKVNASCCAGVTPEAHEHALMCMKSCQIDII